MIQSLNSRGRTEKFNAENSLVTVCVPVYNGLPYLIKTITAVLGQTYRGFTLLVIDDASIDGSGEYLNSINDSRVRFERNRSNLGCVANWNRCLSLCRTPYVSFILQDDPPQKDYLDRMIQTALRYPDAGMVFCKREVKGLGQVDEWILKNVKDVHLKWNSLEEYNAPHMLLKDFLQSNSLESEEVPLDKYYLNRLTTNRIGEPSCTIFKTECLKTVGYFDPKMIQLQDWDMWLRILLHFPIVFYSDYLATFVLHAKSLTSMSYCDGASRYRIGELERIYFLLKMAVHPVYRPLRKKFRDIILRTLEAALAKQLIEIPFTTLLRAYRTGRYSEMWDLLGVIGKFIWKNAGVIPFVVKALPKAGIRAARSCVSVAKRRKAITRMRGWFCSE